MLRWLRSIRDARVRRRLLRDDDLREDIVDEVHHHWVVHTVPAAELLLALGLACLLFWTPLELGWVVFAAVVFAAFVALVWWRRRS